MSIFNRSKIKEARMKEYYNKLEHLLHDNYHILELVNAICEYYKLPIDNDYLSNYRFLNESDLEFIDLFKEIRVLPEIAYNKCVKYINDSIAIRNKVDELTKEYCG